MVCDLLQWRAMELQRPIFEFVRTVADKINNEQDVIAMYFKGKITSLPIKWNMTTFYFRRQPKIFNKYLPQLIDARKAPGIIHFACPIKPWFRDCQHPYKILYKRSRCTFPGAVYWQDLQKNCKSHYGTGKG